MPRDEEKYQLFRLFLKPLEDCKYFAFRFCTFLSNMNGKNEAKKKSSEKQTAERKQSVTRALLNTR